jgi:hypothetical protein
VTDKERLDDLGDLDSANEIFLDRALRHAHYVQRVGAHDAALVVSFLRGEILPEVHAVLTREIAALQRGDFSGAQRVIRARKLESEIAEILGEGAAKIIGEEVGRAVVMARAEGQMLVEAAKESIPKEILDAAQFSLKTGIPPAEVLAAQIRAEPVVGNTIKQWWEDLSDAAAREMARQVNIGLATGETLEEIMARVVSPGFSASTPDVAAKMLRDAESIARTTATAASQAGRDAWTDANADLVKGVMLIETLDGVTCATCQALDGRLFERDKGPRPPHHPRCRGTTITIFKSWSELGIEGVDDFTPTARSSMNGEVPGTMTYAEWFKTQSPAFQREVLGPARYDLWKRGKVPIERFTDVRGRPLRVEELEALERSVEAGAKLQPIKLPGEITA